MFSSKNLPIMPALCSKLAYYAGIMLDALACLLCRHNRRMPNTHTHTHIYTGTHARIGTYMYTYIHTCTHLYA